MHLGWYLGYLPVDSCPVWHGMLEMALLPFSELKLFRETFTPSFLLAAAESNTAMVVLVSLSVSLAQALWAGCHPRVLKGFTGTPEGEERHSWALFGTNWSFPLSASHLLSGDTFTWTGGVTQDLLRGHPGLLRCLPGLQGSGVLGALPWVHPTSRDAFRGWAVIQGFGCEVAQIGFALVLPWEVAVVKQLGKWRKRWETQGIPDWFGLEGT